MDKEKVISFLEEKKTELDNLKEKYYKEGNPELQKIKDSIKMVIRRVYPNPSEVEKNLFHPPFFVLTGNTPDSYFQESFLESIKETEDAVDIILKEIDLFGLDDFTPAKEQTETEVQIGSEKIGGFWRRKKTK